MATLIVLAVLLAQDVPCRDAGAPDLALAAERGEAFDLAGAAAAAFTAAGFGCVEAEIAGHYLRGLLAAREAYRQFASAASLAPVMIEVSAIQARASEEPTLAALAVAVLRAAVAAAQRERDELALRLDHAIRLESVQLEASARGLPIVTAHEVAGDLWLEIHAYDEARQAYQRAANRVGPTPRVTLGLARVATGRNETDVACGLYRDFVAQWASSTEGAAELSEARSYLQLPPCTAPGTAP